MKINGVELEDLDIYDADVAEKYEKQLDKIEKLTTKVEGMGLSEGIRYQCNLIFDIFNELFGEGTDKKVFGEKVNLKTCLNAFAELIEQTNEQKKKIGKLSNKYSPNRAQRRAKKK